eukprot:TRINITY_DN113_c0_g1_i5.p1 TRINITY_DN113_c0_g1~~TRINITY_DN113_c0_g1_i5.p1  ORF type:complete len:105 (+),score=28.66 TRINITY_DN113_c0_g1_i5:141-455(+)
MKILVCLAYNNDQQEDNEEEEHIPYKFLCPITRDILEDPVVAQDGNTYERSAVERWFRQCHSSPMFGTTIGARLVTNQKSQNANKGVARRKSKKEKVPTAWPLV